MTNEILSKALNIMALLRGAGARDVLIVGGFVRDSLLGIQSKDVDIEVYGMPVDAIVATLAPHFSLDVVGKSFGVIKIDNEIDVSVPRRESKIGMGHRDFKIDPDPNMSIRDAASRRDFTINSMAMRSNGEIVDLFNGRVHLSIRSLMHTSRAFVEDPLRVLRGMQLAARFNLSMPVETQVFCKEMLSEFVHLPKERIWEEWKKFATKGVNAVAGMNVLLSTRWIDNFPELAAMEHTPQDEIWHPEGPVLFHFTLVVQEAINIAIRDQLDDNNRMVLFFAALCHDMAKPATTKMEDGRWRAKGHCEEGVAVAESFLISIGAPRWLIDHVKPLVMAHLVHAGAQPTDRAVKRLALRLRPSSINMLSRLIESDHSGRKPLPKGNPFLPWLEAANKLNLSASQPVAILQGRHLISLGVKPGPTMGNILRDAFEAQLDGIFLDEATGVEWLTLRVGRSDV